MGSLDRRGFLRRVALASAATAGSGLAAGKAHSQQGDVGQLISQSPRWHRAPCNLCGVGCGLLVGVDHGRAVAVKGDPDCPVNAGLACAKGYHSVQAPYGNDRLNRALVRRNGSLVGVPLAQALDLVATRLGETIAESGRDSVALFGSARWSLSDAYVASKVFKGGLGCNNVETEARLMAGSGMAGLSATFGLDGSIGSYQDVEQADLFVVWGANLAETDPVLFSRMLDRKRVNPSVRILVLASRTTRTGYAADRTLLYQPHTTLAIANAIAHEIVNRGPVALEFLDRHVAFKSGRAGLDYGLEGEPLVTEEAVDVGWQGYQRFLEDYTPQRAQALSGLPASDISWLASLYADPSLKVTSIWGREVNEDHRGTWLNNALYNIHLLVGKVATPGNNPLCTTGLASGGSEVGAAGSLGPALPRGAVSDPGARQRAAEIWGVPAQNLNPSPAGSALGIFRALERGDIRFLWIQSANPMASLPNLHRYRRAVSDPDRFIVVSDAYPTQTTDLADVVLPSALWLERDGAFVNVERRVQLANRIVAPPGDALSDGAQLIAVANRMGLGDLFPYGRDGEIALLWEEYRRFHDGSATALPPVSALESRAGVSWPYLEGRETSWRYNVDYDPLAEDRIGRFDFYGHPDHRAWIWLRPFQPPAESPDGDFPFWLSTGAVVEHSDTGTITQRIPTLHRAIPHAYAEVNAEDARDLGIRHGEKVRLTSRRGSIELEARIDYRAQPIPGHVFVPQFDEGALVNLLTLDAACPLSGQAAPGAAVRLARVSRPGG